MAEAKKTAKPAETFVRAAEQVTHTAQHSAEAMAPPFAGTSRFEFPRFEFPNAYRDIAEKGIAQAKQNYERLKAAAEGATDLVETTLTTATMGLSEYNLKLIEAMRANVNAQFDFAASLFAVKSPSEAVELSSAHARKQFETISAQGKELASLAQRVSTETVEPIKTGFNKALRLVA